ncbi:hypothetical protein GJ496_011416 [Pomphorhynchus laevis]|nr:hypothetical protein GJ496_011416 [Pomphorhynchus laevis]
MIEMSYSDNSQDTQSDMVESFLEITPSSKYYDVASRIVAFDYFNRLISVPDIIQIRLTTSYNLTVATLGCKQYYLNTNQELHYSNLILVRHDLPEISSNIFNLNTRIGHKSEYVNISIDGSKIASISEGSDGYYIAIGGASKGIECAIDMSESNVISKIYKPSRDFGAFEWSPDNKFIIVVVRPGRNPHKPLSAPLTVNSILENKQYVDRSGPGEGLNKIDDFSIAVLNVSSAFVNLISTPDGYYPSQFTYDNVNTSFYFVGVKNDPSYSVGLLYCSNRPTKIFMAQCTNPNNPDGQWTVEQLLNGESSRKCYHSPRISPDGKTLVYTSNLSSGPHNHCRSICKVHIPYTSTSEKILVDIIEDQFEQNQTHLPSNYIGLYEDLPDSCWLSDSNFIVFSASNGFFMHMYRLTVAEGLEEYGHLVRINPPKTNYSTGGCWTVKSVYQDQIIVTFSSCEKSLEILIGKISNPISVNNQINLHWLVILHGTHCFSHLTIQGKLLSNPVPHPSGTCAHPDDNNQGIFEQSFLITSVGLSELAPTVVCVHGGPNSAFHDEFTQTYATIHAFVASGFNVLELNYVGSSGYGQRSLRFLTGYVLDRDVDSCVRLIRDACSKHNLNRKRLFFLGGSHSGGIGIHLMSRYPNMFAAAVLRNPVCDYITLLINSDIPDYTFHQVLKREFEMDFDFDNSVVETLMKKNPLTLARNLKTPLLLILGSNDIRVPYRAALRLKQMLKKRNIPCKARIYPEGHAIKSTAYMQDSFVHMYDWFLNFLPVPNLNDDLCEDDNSIYGENNDIASQHESS